MSEFDTGADTTANNAEQAFRRWIQEQHSAMSGYAIDHGLLQNDGTGLPIWAVPHRVFLAKLIEKGKPDGGYWYISGEMPSDHIELRLAASAREAARHFSLKWQLQAANIETGSGSDSASDELTPTDWANVGASLTRSAEALAQFVEADEFWANVKE